MLIRRLKFKGSSRSDFMGSNVLIGPNGSGKSNLLDVLALLQAAPRELVERSILAAECESGCGRRRAARHGTLRYLGLLAILLHPAPPLLDRLRDPHPAA